MLARWQVQQRAGTYKQQVKSTLGMVWVFWSCKVHPQWHTFSNEATIPNPFPTVPPTGDRVFKHQCWRPQSAQWQARHGREQLEKEASWSHLNCTQETIIKKLCIIYVCVCMCMIMMTTTTVIIVTPQSLSPCHTSSSKFPRPAQTMLPTGDQGFCKPVLDVFIQTPLPAVLLPYLKSKSVSFLTLELKWNNGISLNWKRCVKKTWRDDTHFIEMSVVFIVWWLC